MSLMATDTGMTKILRWVLCALTTVNFVLFVLTLFVPAFSGIGEKPGLADRLWGNPSGGWRADVVWVFMSTIAILILWLAYVESASDKGTREYKLVFTSCAVWMGCFVVYVGYVLLHMMG